MTDIKKLEERLNNLEAKLKATFREIEKRLSEISAPDKNYIEERFQELEDLILVTQVEQMKIKEKMESSVDFGFNVAEVAGTQPQEKQSEHDFYTVKTTVEMLEKTMHEIEEKMSELEHLPAKKVEVIKQFSVPVQKSAQSNILAEINKILASN